MAEEYLLWFVFGNEHYDIASCHETLEEAIEVAETGEQYRYVTQGMDDVVWSSEIASEDC